MLEETGTVMAVKHGQVLVETSARSACSHCTSQGCTTAVLGRLFGVRRNRVRLANTLHAQIGDRVVIGVPDDVLVRASLLVYLAPLASMMLAVAAADGAGLGLGAQIGAAAAGLAGGLLLVGRVGESNMSRRRYRMRLLRKVPPIAVGALELKANGS